MARNRISLFRFGVGFILLACFYGYNVAQYSLQSCWSKESAIFNNMYYNRCSLPTNISLSRYQNISNILSIIAGCLQNNKVQPGSIGQVITVLACLWDTSKTTVNPPANFSIMQQYAKVYDILLSESDEAWSHFMWEFSIMLLTMDAVANTTAAFIPDYKIQKNNNTNDTKNIVIRLGSEDGDIRFSFSENSDNDSHTLAEVYLPQNAYKPHHDSVKYSSIVYKNVTGKYRINSTLQESFPDKDVITGKSFLSSIVSFSLVQTYNISQMLRITFFNTKQTVIYDSVCVFLNESVRGAETGVWSKLTKTDGTNQSNKVDCFSDHLTNFAVLFSLNPKKSLVLDIISITGCAISIFCLLVTIIVYFIFWRYVKGCWSVLHLNLCVWLIMAYVVFLVGVDRTENVIACMIVSILLHLIFLVVFFLMLCEGLMVLLSVTFVFRTRMLFKALLTPAYCIPLIIVVVSVGVTKTEGYGTEQSCWIHLDLSSGLTWSFIGPVLVVLLVNFIILIKVLIVMQTRAPMRKESHHFRLRSVVRTVCVLCPVLGFTWVFGVLSVSTGQEVFQYMFAIFNSLQGLLIFICHCILHPKVREGVKKSKYVQTPARRNQPPNIEPADEHLRRDNRANFDIDNENRPSSIKYYRDSQEGQGKENPVFDSFHSDLPQNNDSSVSGEAVGRHSGSSSMEARATHNSSDHQIAGSSINQEGDVTQDIYENMQMAAAASSSQSTRTSLKDMFRRLSKKLLPDTQKEAEELRKIYTDLNPVHPEPYNKTGQNQGIKHRVKFGATDRSTSHLYRESSSQPPTPSTYTQHGV